MGILQLKKEVRHWACSPPPALLLVMSTLVLICYIRTQNQFVQQAVKVDPNGKAVITRPIKTCRKHRKLSADAPQPSLRGRYEQLNNCDMSLFFRGGSILSIFHQLSFIDWYKRHMYSIYIYIYTQSLLVSGTLNVNVNVMCKLWMMSLIQLHRGGAAMASLFLKISFKSRARLYCSFHQSPPIIS